MQSLGLCTTVLEPDLHLSLCKCEGAGELGTLSNRQILLLVEFALKCQQLSCGKGCAWLAVRLVFAQCALRTDLPCKKGLKTNYFTFYWNK